MSDKVMKRKFIFFWNTHPQFQEPIAWTLAGIFIYGFYFLLKAIVG